MRSRVGDRLCVLALCLAGCGGGGATVLTYAPPDPMLASLACQDSLGAKPKRILLPCVVTVRHSDASQASSGTVVPVRRVLRRAFEDAARRDGLDVFVPSPKYTTDNAAMIAAAGFLHLERGRLAGLDLNARTSLKL